MSTDGISTPSLNISTEKITLIFPLSSFSIASKKYFVSLPAPQPKSSIYAPGLSFCKNLSCISVNSTETVPDAKDCAFSL